MSSVLHSLDDLEVKPSSPYWPSRPVRRSPTFTPRPRAVTRNSPIVSYVDRGMSRVVNSVAGAISRRQLLRGIGGVALTAGLGAALVGTEFALPANANGTCNSPCGPSPICTGDECQYGVNGFCNGLTAVYRGAWPSSPGCYSSPGCWDENWCSGGCTAGNYRCCDCCSLHSYTSQCSNCSTTSYKCICRNKQSGC